MDRRKFLGGVAVGATSTALPLWLSNAFQRQPLPPQGCELPRAQPPAINDSPARQPIDATPLAPGDPHLTLRDAFSRARSMGRPLLVFGIPADKDKNDWGVAYGAFLNFASDDDLVLLSLCELYCATLEDLQEFTQATPSMMVLLETFTAKPVARNVAFSLEPPPEGVLIRRTPEEQQLFIEKIITEMGAALRLVLVGPAPKSALAVDDSLLNAREAQLSSVYPDAARFAENLRYGMVAPQSIEKASAFLYRYSTYEDRKAQLLLLQEVRLRLCLQPPANSRWAVFNGCGIAVEGSLGGRGGAGCGMGQTHKLSRRFLHFFTDKNPF